MSNLSREEMIQHLKSIIHYPDPQLYSVSLSSATTERIIELFQSETTMEKGTGWKEIAYEYFHHSGRMGHFYYTLCMAIQIADRDNTERLRKGFPELVAYIKGETKVE